VSRTALVRIPDGTRIPDGWTFVGWYETRPPRRYAVVADVTAWTAWVARRAPWHLVKSGDGVMASRDFESRVRRMVATTGGWREPGTEGPVELVPGVEARTDSAVRIHVTTPDGSIDSWESPVDVTPEGVAS
jgi:hypothetical protein